MELSLDTKIKELEETILDTVQCKHLYRAYEKLIAYPEWNTVIINGFLTEYVDAAISRLQTDKRDTAILELQSVSTFKQYLKDIKNRAITAEMDAVIADTELNTLKGELADGY